jgi:tagatose-6-phosphate ketose/aldose isomerase
MEIISPEQEWLNTLSVRQKRIRELFARTQKQQQELGYFHTLREICRQPRTWRETGELMIGSGTVISACLRGVGSLVLTGSGSSEYAGDCVRAALQTELGITCLAVGGGSLLTENSEVLPTETPRLMVSLARSGDSPESAGAMSLLLDHDPEMRHLVLTCNGAGTLARTYRDRPRVSVIALSEETNDQSLVMTSSFTNLVLAARFLGLTEQPDLYRTICHRAATIATEILASQFDRLAEIAESGFERVVFLGSGARYGGCREAALKMLEMTAGKVTSLCETYLGLRHGPMSYIDKETLVVGFLSSDPTRRNYESDLLRELDQKHLGMRKLIVGEGVPKELTREGDVVIECPGMAQLGDRNAALVDVVVGQLLAFFRCMQEGLHPDSPSQDNVINRVVQPFRLYGR